MTHAIAGARWSRAAKAPSEEGFDIDKFNERANAPIWPFIPDPDEPEDSIVLDVLVVAMAAFSITQRAR